MKSPIETALGDRWLIVGLGNPGSEYAATRHNIGFMAVDALAHASRASSSSKKFHGEISDATLGSKKLLLLKPLTFMNLSGKSVQAAAAFYKITPANILVIHDELDLPVGKCRIKLGGGNNGHNGLRDIDRVMGENYWRMRLGIGHPGDKAQVHGHVLNDFTVDEHARVEKQLQALIDHFSLFFTHSPEILMTKLAATLTPPKEKPAAG